MKPRNDIKFRPNMIVALGLLILFWGFHDFVASMQELGQILEGRTLSATDEGFAPYLVPVDEKIDMVPVEYAKSVDAPNMVLSDTINHSDSIFVKPEQLGKEFVQDSPSPDMVHENKSDLKNALDDDFTGVPTHIVIPAIQLDAPIIYATFTILKSGAQYFDQWQAPDEYAAGWHNNSALLGEEGNLVLNGHHNTEGEVFRRLVDLKTGDYIQVYSGIRYMEYLVTNKVILPEKYVDLPTRLDNSRWIQPSDDQRLTLVTCWPYESNTHRLIIVAMPRSGVVQ